MKKNAVFFFANSLGIGLTTHLARQIVDMYKKEKNFDLYIISTEKEQEPGLWLFVRESILPRNIIMYHKKTDLVRTLDNIIVSYSKVLFHMQGLRHVFLVLRFLKKQSVHSVFYVNSFANSKRIQRILHSCFITYLVWFLGIEKIIFTCPFSMKIFTGIGILKKMGRVLHIPFALPEQNEDKAKCKRKDVRILSDKNFNVVYIAQLHPHKQHLFFLDALISFAKKHDDVKIHFFGSGRCHKKILSVVSNNSLQDKILLHGRIPHSELLLELSHADVALLLSASETFGHATLEPMQNGIPVIGTGAGIAEYLIQDGITGFQIYNSPPRLYQALEILYQAPEMRVRMGNNAKRISTMMYRYDDMIQALFITYKELFEQEDK